MLGYFPSNYCSNRGVCLIYNILAPIQFFKKGANYIPKALYICGANYEILCQKVTKAISV